jgi:hypothetical protein
MSFIAAEGSLNATGWGLGTTQPPLRLSYLARITSTADLIQSTAMRPDGSLAVALKMAGGNQVVTNINPTTFAVSNTRQQQRTNMNEVVNDSVLQADAAGDIYVAGQQGEMGKLTGGGSTVSWWNFTMPTTGGAGGSPRKHIAVDSLGNSYYTTMTQPPSGFSGLKLYVCKRNSAGVLQWAFNYQNNNFTTSTDMAPLALAASNNFVYVLVANATATAGGIGVLKIDGSTGAVNSQIGVNRYVSDYGMCVDNLDNVYFVTWHFNAPSGMILMRLNSSLAIVWQRTFSNNLSEGLSLSLDANNNLYLCGNVTTKTLRIFKINSADGSMIFGRSITHNGVDSFPIPIKTAGDTMIAGADRARLLYVLPTDGTLTGTYSVGGLSVTYASFAVTSSTSTLGTVTAGMVRITPALTSGTVTNSVGTNPTVASNDI